MRLIDADAVVKMVDKHTNDDMTLDDDITCILEEIPTAYDVEKVVKKMGERSEYTLNGYSDVVTMQNAISFAFDLIDIVKGGVE